MIQFAAFKYGQPAVGIGLTRANMDTLIGGGLLELDLSELGEPGQIPKVHLMLLGGESEEAMVERLRKIGILQDKPPVTPAPDQPVPRISGVVAKAVLPNKDIGGGMMDSQSWETDGGIPKDRDDKL